MARQRNTLKEPADKLQQLDKLKSNFFANISHEFRTRLTLILGCIDALKKTARDKKAADLNVIDANASRLLELVNQLLELSKFEAGSVTLKASPHNLAQTLPRITNSFKSLAESRGIQLAFNDLRPDPGEELTVFYEESKFDKIILNLLSNALKFTPPQGNVRVTLDSIKSQDYTHQAQLRVMNSGPGISAEHLPYIN